MSHRVILSPDAKVDIRSTVRWYKQTELNLAFRFTLERRATRRRIARSPIVFPLVKDAVRRALMKRFPYAIYFALNKDAVFVIAVLHQRRVNTVWMDRENGRTG
jgi:plasmid stabilization system protein ParE